MKKIFGYCKEINPTWPKVSYFVIDKHFVKWGVMEACFPSADVLLCQFHAIMYWKRLVCSRLKLKLEDQDKAQCLFATMMYRNQCEQFDQAYKEFCSFCENGHSGVRLNFDKNWKGYRKMWSNYLRNKVPFAGNTTTNRIESNWNLLKQLLEKKKQQWARP